MMPETTTGWALLAVVASHALYVVLLVLRAMLGNRQDRDFLGEGILHGVSAYTALLWGPFVLALQALRALVLDPLRLDLEWGGDHDDSTTNPAKFTRGRTMRKVAPRVSVGTYTFRSFNRETDRETTTTNQIVTLGWRHVGLTVIRSGLPVDDARKPAWALPAESDS
jgi:hypothetical protein